MKHPFHIQIPYIPETRKGEKEKEQEIVKVPHCIATKRYERRDG